MRILLAATLLLLPPAFAQEATWLTDFEAAKAAAKKEQKKILANFTGSDWCGWCIKLDNEVFRTPEFATWASDKVVLLQVDFPRTRQLPAERKEQNDKLARAHGVTGYPTVLVLDADGKQVGKLGYKAGGPAAWIKVAEEQLATKPATSTEAGEHGDWMTDYEAALKQAKKEKKIVIANFTGSDWCGWCVKLANEVFGQQEFKDWARDHAVLLELDFPNKKQLPEALQKQNDKLAKEFRIEGYPTILFLDGNGKELGRGGYEKGGPPAWIAMAEQTAGIKSKKGKAPRK